LRKIGLFILVASLMGCATPMPSQLATLQNQKTCCASLADFVYKPLALENELTFSIESRSPVFDFPTGKSYFSAFALPTGNSRGVRVSSFFNGIWITQYFQPIFLFLDDKKQPLIAATPNLRFSPTRLTADAQMIGGVRVPDAAAFLVIYTRDFSDTKVTAVIPGSSSVFMAGPTPIMVQNPATGKTLELSPTGELRLRVETISP
jgi:maltose operon periplasmic protein